MDDTLAYPGVERCTACEYVGNNHFFLDDDSLPPLSEVKRNIVIYSPENGSIFVNNRCRSDCNKYVQDEDELHQNPSRRQGEAGDVAEKIFTATYPLSIFCCIYSITKSWTQ